MMEIAKRTDCHCEMKSLVALSPRNSAPEARWRSGDAADCKSTDYSPLSSTIRTNHAPFLPRLSAAFREALRNKAAPAIGGAA